MESTTKELLAQLARKYNDMKHERDIAMEKLDRIVAIHERNVASLKEENNMLTASQAATINRLKLELSEEKCKASAAIAKLEEATCYDRIIAKAVARDSFRAYKDSCTNISLRELNQPPACVPCIPFIVFRDSIDDSQTAKPCSEAERGTYNVWVDEDSDHQMHTLETRDCWRLKITGLEHLLHIARKYDNITIVSSLPNASDMAPPALIIRPNGEKTG